jgi:hypothetical protein
MLLDESTAIHMTIGEKVSHHLKVPRNSVPCWFVGSYSTYPVHHLTISDSLPMHQPADSFHKGYGFIKGNERTIALAFSKIREKRTRKT